MRPVLVVGAVLLSVFLSGCGSRSRSVEQSVATPAPRERSPVRSEDKVASYDLASERGAFEFTVAGKAGAGADESTYSTPSPHEELAGPFRRGQSARREPSRWPSIPRWAVLLAVILGACAVDSMLTRNRP